MNGVFDLQAELGRVVDRAVPAATATSTYDAGTIDRRLHVLSSRTDVDAARERDYLVELRRRKFGAPPTNTADRAVGWVQACDRRLLELDGRTDAAAVQERARLLEARPRHLARFPARSIYTVQTIDARLRELAARDDQETARERTYLKELRARKFPEAPPV